SGYRPQGRRRTRSTTSCLRSTGNSYGFSFWSSFTSAAKCSRAYAVRPRTSGFMTPDEDGSRMCSQSFGDCEFLNHFSKTLDGAAGIANNACALHKVRHAERRKEPGSAVCRQYMTRAGEVIAHYRWRVSPNENRARIADLVGNVVGFGHEHFNMLW